MNIHLNAQYGNDIKLLLRLDLLKTAFFAFIILCVGLTTNVDKSVDVSDIIPFIGMITLAYCGFKLKLKEPLVLLSLSSIAILLVAGSLAPYLSWVKNECLWIINVGFLGILYLKNNRLSFLFFAICMLIGVGLFVFENLIQAQFGFGIERTLPNAQLYNFLLFFFFLLDIISRFYLLIYMQQRINEDLNKRNLLEEQYSILFHNSFNPILQYDYNNNKITEFNDSFVEMIGYSKEELRSYKERDILVENGVEFGDIISKEWSVKSDTDSVGNNGKLIRANSVFKDKEGEEKFCDIHILPLKDKSGKAYIICHDNTDEINYRKELEKSRNDYKNIFDNSLLGVVVLDADFNIQKVNHSFCEMMGYMAKELINEKIFRFTNEKSLEESRELSDLIKHAKIHSYIQENTYVRKDNREFEALISVKGIYKNGVLVQSIATVQDITHRKDVELSLRESEGKYRDIFDNSLSGLAIIEDGNFREANTSFCDIFNVESNQINGQNFFDFIHPEDLNYVKQEINVTIQNSTSNKRLIHRIKIGDDIKTIMANIAVRDGSDKDNYFAILNCIDLTEFMDMQSQLNERQAIYEALIENSFTGIDVVELEGVDLLEASSELIVRNNKMSQFLSEDPKSKATFLTFNQLKKITPKSLTHGESAHDVYKETLKELSQTGTVQNEWSLIVNGKVHDFVIHLQIVNVNGKQILIRDFQDVTERRKKDQIILNQLFELNKKNQELEKYIESNLQLENFAYIASHDLKAPLRTVSSFAYLLKKSSYDDMNVKDRKYLDIIITSAGNMQVLIHDLLHYARINSQKVNFKTIEFESFIARCVQDIYQDIKDYRGEVVYNDIPKTIVGDEIKLTQLFQNLIRNGLKFHRDGVDPVIEISCQEKEKEYVFSVKDNGIGIEENQQDKIFGIFSKLHSSDQFEGTGLGLTISKKIIEQHNGNIWLKSEPGQGTTFYFSLLKELFMQEVDTDHLQNELNQISTN